MTDLYWRVSMCLSRDARIRAVMLGVVVICLLIPGALFSQTTAPRQLGKVDVLSGPVECDGGNCYDIRVTCPQVAAPARAQLKVGVPGGSSPRGTILFTSGGLGTEWYGSPRILTDVAAAGFRTVQLQWVDSWLLGSAGQEEGHVRLGCRPATVARWVYDHLYEQGPSGAFCATGHSGGAAQVSYLLSHYGLEELLAAVVPTGGPPMARMDRSCARDDPANASLAFPDWATRVIDAGFGFLPPGDPQSFNPFGAPAVGPCAKGDASFREMFRRASVDSGDGDYVYPRTLVWFVFEGIDDTHAVAMGTTYFDLLMKMGSPLVRKTIVPDVSHAGPKGLYASSTGTLAVRDILLSECRPRTP